jgi:nitroimidazol reductase NimA-like FMN-containing flavoprotein (pyridoxamine 5'-phosphate oxidase superfamily)
MSGGTTPDRLPAIARPAAAAPLVAPDREPIPYDRVLRVLAESPFVWLSTTRATGAPHVRPVLVVVVDGRLYSSSNLAAAKARNLAGNPQ